MTVWPTKIRDCDIDQDDGLIFKTWIDSLKHHPPWREMTFADFRVGQHAKIERTLCRSKIEARIAAHPSGEPKYGWICTEPYREGIILHYVYVRSGYRQSGIASQLLEASGVDIGTTPIICTAWTKSLSYHKHRWNLTFNPFILDG